MKFLYLQTRYLAIVDILIFVPGTPTRRRLPGKETRSLTLPFLSSFFSWDHASEMQNTLIDSLVYVLRHDSTSHFNYISMIRVLKGFNSSASHALKVRMSSYSSEHTVLTGGRPPPVIMAIRTWALWERNKRVGIGLLVMIVVALAVVCYILGAFVESLACTYPKCECWRL